LLIEQLDDQKVKALLPKRPDDANKGRFGKVLLLTGSDVYRGAASLSVEAALRSGVGYVYFASEKPLADVLLSRFPEVIYHAVPRGDKEKLSALSVKMTATIFGCGSGNTEETKKTVQSLLSTKASPLVLDADALNALGTDAESFLSCANRAVLLTPHPGEFATMTGLSVPEIEGDRIGNAVSFAAKTHTVLLLKGKETVITDGVRVFINKTGDTSLAKAGSGDVLAGFIGGLCAMGAEPLFAAAIGAYLHGKAGQTLGAVLSPYGVTASDLPVAIAKEIQKLLTK